MRLVVAALVSLVATGVVPGLAVGASAQEPPPYGEPPPQPYGQPDPYAQQQGQYDQQQQGQYDQQQQYAQQPQEVEAAPQYGYVGPHPEPYDYGHGACYQSGVHFHPYPPFDQYLFRQSNGYFYFIGDLGDFGYTGQLYGYQGHHPIPFEYGGGFCYMDWPHRHPFAAPASLPFRFVGGYYSYYGPWDAAYYANRASWVGYYGGYYRNSYYGGRYWTVRPAPVYRVNLGWGHPGVYRPGMVVRSPSGVTVTVGGHYGGGYGHPGVVVGAPRPGYVAPRPGYVAPPPGRPGYVAPAPRPGYVAPPPARTGGYVAPPPAHTGGYAAPPPSHAAPPPMAAPAPARRPVAPPPPSAPTRRH